MGKRKKEVVVDEGGGIDPEGWMDTMADLVFLLITFFVLLISSSSMDDKALKEAFGFFDDAISVMNFSKDKSRSDRFMEVLNPMSAFSVTKEMGAIGSSLKTGRGNARKLLKTISRGLSSPAPLNGLLGTLKTLSEQTGGEIRIEKLDNGFAVIMPGRLLFPDGNNDLDEEARALLADLSLILKLWGGEIDVIAFWNWHEGPKILGQICEVLESNWIKGELIHPKLHPVAERTVRFVMRQEGKE